MRKVNLELLNGDKEDFDNFNDYESKFNQQVDQRKWSIHNKNISEDEKALQYSRLELEITILFPRQKKKFFSDDPLEFDRSMERLKRFAKQMSDQDVAIRPYVKKIVDLYQSNDIKEKSRGRLAFRIAVIEAYGEELHFMEDWDNDTFHGSIEIENVFSKLYQKNKLDLILEKMNLN